MTFTKLFTVIVVLSFLVSCSTNADINRSKQSNSQTSKFAKYDTPPKVVKPVPPHYPEFVKKMGIEGDVWLDVEILSDGTVGDVKVEKSLMSGPGGLDEAAVNAVKQWKFEPAMDNGIAVGCRVNFPITFAIEHIKQPKDSAETSDLTNLTSQFAVYDTPPEAIKRVAPRYPKIYQRKGIGGEVWLNIEVFQDGSVGEVEVSQSLDSSTGGLDDCAVEAVKQWKFKPAKHKGIPVACWITFPINFSLK